MAKNKKQQRFGLFYRSNGRWTTSPYLGKTFTAYQISRNPIKTDIAVFKNYLLKSRVRIRPVSV